MAPRVMTGRRPTAASPRASRSAGAAVQQATITALDASPGRVHVRVSRGGSIITQPALARLALSAPYRPAEGDRVLVAADEDALYVIGVLHAAVPPSLPLPDGGSVSVSGEVVELRDPAGRLLVRYANGSAEIAAPAGDLTLAAPEGRVTVRAGRDIALSAAGELSQRAGQSVVLAVGAGDAAPQLRVGAATTELEAERLEVKVDSAHVAAGQATVLAQRIATTATALVQNVERLELTATRLIEKTRDAFRDTSDLAQTRAGRVRTVVSDVFALFSRRTTMASDEETSIDGSKILLG
jgi:hypothetical protein